MASQSKEYTFERNSDGDYHDFIQKVVKSFMYNFTHDIEGRLSPVNNVKHWMINTRKLPRVRNCLIKSLKDEIAKEDLRIISVAKDEALIELQKMIDNAKEDLELLNVEINKKVDEEL